METIDIEKEPNPPPPPPLPEKKTVSKGRGWRRVKLIGRGSFGCVHMAKFTEPRASRFEDLPPLMAVKSSHGPSTESVLEREMFLLLHFSQCRYVIRQLASEETPLEDGTSRLDVFLELASGGTLARLIRYTDGPLHERSVARRHTRSILTAVWWIHDGGFVHCDLKPDNVLLVKEGDEFVAKVADFGAAKRAGQSGGVRGTMKYWAPESACLGVQDKASDIWALGCIVLKMLGGMLPWECADYEEMRGMIATEPPILPVGISAEAVSFLRMCFARNPEDRPSAWQLMHHPFVCPLDDAGGKGGCGVSGSLPYALLDDDIGAGGDDDDEDEYYDADGDDDDDEYYDADDDDDGGDGGGGGVGHEELTRWSFWMKEWIADLVDFVMPQHFRLRFITKYFEKGYFLQPYFNYFNSL